MHDDTECVQLHIPFGRSWSIDDYTTTTTITTTTAYSPGSLADMRAAALAA